MKTHVWIAATFVAFLGIQEPLCAAACASDAPTLPVEASAHPCHGAAPASPDAPPAPESHDCTCDESGHALLPVLEAPPAPPAPAGLVAPSPLSPFVPVRAAQRWTTRPEVEIPPRRILLMKASLRL